MVDHSKVAKLTAQMVPIFSGGQGADVSTELQTFLGCCKRVIQCLTEEEQTAFLQIFPTRLRGEAYQLLASNPPTTFDEAERLLNRIYLPRETYQELVNKLITLRQYPLESLTVFTTRLKQLLSVCQDAAAAKYGANAAPAARTQLEDFAKNALRSGVTNPHLCQYLLTIGEDTLDNLIQKALDMERLQQMTLIDKTPTNFALPTHTQNYPLTPPIPTNTRDVFNRGSETTAVSTKPPYFNSGTNPPPPGQRFTHNRPTPFPRRETQQESQSRPHNTESLLSRITCSFCQRRGHTYDDCLKRKNTPFCTICRTYNHDARDCRSALPGSRPPSLTTRPTQNTLNPTPPTQPPRDRPRVFNIRVSCDFCGRRGHTVEECRQKQKWETRAQGNPSQSGQESPARR